jgi:hypothetical protein
MSNNAGWLLLGLTPLASAVALVACTASGSANVRGSMVAKLTIEQTASKQITDRLGGGTYVVTCPHDLAAKTGASMACVTTFPDGEKFTGTATVTSASGGTAHLKYIPSSRPVEPPQRLYRTRHAAALPALPRCALPHAQ